MKHVTVSRVTWVHSQYDPTILEAVDAEASRAAAAVDDRTTGEVDERLAAMRARKGEDALHDVLAHPQGALLIGRGDLMLRSYSCLHLLGSPPLHDCVSRRSEQRKRVI
eukprot:CAMPEP_0113275946 /NCGR_PEP_ID=MMETSP0008_2-20120614/25223_1 /TAXON_ID=97485 /ORGANISM="Prymnesium parvum" /LENGTH=108 /DNA_ID=CAMNT_0000125699 /DNA_START=376 /DNA_END=702 /DNA_ORIENTATION=+ /assembly_acc=CAM_ASM_000153